MILLKVSSHALTDCFPAVVSKVRHVEEQTSDSVHASRTER